MTEFLTAPRPIRSVLIANRGEIACRIIATCRKLGLRSVAVHSEADTGAAHVLAADLALCIGPAPSRESYLNIDAVIGAARASGADAVHPGYGFLSENPEFVRACEDAGLIFIGPSAKAVAAMGSKIEARRIADAAGVPVVPGVTLEPDDPAFAEQVAALGFPVLVKASAGGGGRGMRRVDHAGQLADALTSARAEAVAAFGDATVFVEKLILSPRHLEVQVFGDGQGGALHLYERDCSVQRNHQKLIEEAPAPDLPETVRARLLEHALKLTRTIDYEGAGTVEFIMESGGDSPYFLEMNTRLQVEHPVTEAICGVDLVEWQLRQAAGLALPLTQEQIIPRGHAIELRLNAERPHDGFLPGTGRVIDLLIPPGLRFDGGFGAGSEVSAHYDSLLGKLIVHRPARAEAVAALLVGLEGLAMPGLATNQALLADCLRVPAFAQGRATTGFLALTFPDGWQPAPETLAWLRGHAALAALAGEDTPFRRMDGFRTTGKPGRVPLAFSDEYGSGVLTLLYGPAPLVETEGKMVPLGTPPLRIWHEGKVIHAAGQALTIAFECRPLAAALAQAELEQPGHGVVRAPLTGQVTTVHVRVGDQVSRGTELVVMEAMKLIHTLAAPIDGTVTRVSCAPGQTLTAQTVLVEIDDPKEEKS
ncbi:MAG TPA: ATP-grasp domain-containing protein [Paracoccus sp.]|nr:ATP-grasp domain-containing protein [Paracoccus sp. (in: a-proteobacteria)]